jgi:hypothetical protein
MFSRHKGTKIHWKRMPLRQENAKNRKDLPHLLAYSEKKIYFCESKHTIYFIVS